MDSTPLIEARHLSRWYGTHAAVADVTFELARGEVVGFLGPNGAGKTTTMQMLTGNLAPSEGGISIGGIDILEQPKAAKARLGYLPERPPLYLDHTVDEFLRYCALLHRVDRGLIAQRVSEVKERCALSEVGGRLIANLSKGYQQRTGIAQAIIHHPDVIILDEPTSGLDPIQNREIRSLIRELGGEHGVILSTHILPEVQATCDRVQIIHRGTLILSDSIAGLNRRMALSSLVIGLRRPPEQADLQSLSGITEVEPLGAGRFRITHPPQQELAEALAQQAVDANWGLFELTPERQTLEDIFVDITTDSATPEVGG